MNEDEKVDPFEYFNDDISLLAVHVLLEGFYRGQNTFTLKNFLKDNHWKMDEIRPEIIDSEDYGSIADLVLHQVVRMVANFELGKIKRISVTTIYGLTETFVREIMNEKDASEEKVHYYSHVIDKIGDLRKAKDFQLEERHSSGMKEVPNRLDFSKDDFASLLEGMCDFGAPFIEIEIDFDDEKAWELHQNVDEYISCFSDDTFIDKTPKVREKRFYFSKQLENFVEYVQRLPVIDGQVNIPFSALEEKGFEVVKIMSYLERKRRIKVRNWNDDNLWNVKFHQTPITFVSLSGQETVEKEEKVKEIKLNLSFSPQTGAMLLSDQSKKEYKVRVQGQVQKEVLRVIFQNPKDTYSEWSLYDISERLGKEDVNEKAVKNALYQFNRKVQLSMPDVDTLFDVTKHSARLNPKYFDRI